MDGLIALSPDLAAAAFRKSLPRGFPVVLLNCDSGKTGYASIRVDNCGGALAMTRHLLGLGHRRIAFIRGPAGNHDAAERLRGFREALAPPRRHPGSSRSRATSARRRATPPRKKLLRARARPTAVFAANDAMAIGLLSAFRERRVRVPEDVALAGFDDIPIARFITPPLTTVRVPIAELGARATARLLHALGANGIGSAARRGDPADDPRRPLLLRRRRPEAVQDDE